MLLLISAIYNNKHIVNIFILSLLLYFRSKRELVLTKILLKQYIKESVIFELQFINKNNNITFD